ncbi:hypothetical protein A3I57_03685 [Candidatus Beckwithbacteria bacterium RIFCSPLOWO2_02_FULL_47_23]|uniref:Polymerase nucleotidyl transferase domain-containing protein n=2 Tax=Candidatus Beckwithiibacteriota TaxID=1752726 RepID=A0A1F5DT77_9BACT|nr:MAG: hypothetical protein A3E73_00480 [Candidatus Beckwithbacteria bacterium RIFCSPHIGHO2_12_FULL_47_17]OGD58378.1 MAG: hypothetical protein A3I57_03685 [Candidatus Beckwithbacteria bacterium RIFCSPLOWO2_02_FULL_47_23]
MFKTIAYADIFDYPLKADELQRWLIQGDSFAPAKVSPYWIKTNRFYHLPGRSKIISLRRQRQHFSHLKWPIAYRAAKILSFIPSVKLVAVTGALAMNNSDQDDDIDLMIITTKNRLWLVRALAMALLLPWLRRGRKINNRLCLNLWLDETTLAIKRRNLYIAHEICQAQPVFERDQTYQKFIAANLWYKNFLPNWKI